MNSNKFGIIVYAALLIVCVRTCFAEIDEECRHPRPLQNPHDCCPLPNLVSEEIMETCAEYAWPPHFHEPPRSRDNNDVDSAAAADNDDEDSDGDDDNNANDSDDSRPHPHPHPPAHRRPHPHHYGPCFLDCLFNETRILDDNNQLDEDRLVTYLSTTLQDNADMIPTAHEAFKTCANKVEEFKALMEAEMAKHLDRAGEHAKRDSWHHRCHPLRAFVMGCVHMEIFSNCPAALWNNSAECGATRDYLAKCRLV